MFHIATWMWSKAPLAKGSRDPVKPATLLPATAETENMTSCKLGSPLLNFPLVLHTRLPR